MKYHEQRIKHDPENGLWGDCFPTSLACILDLEPDEVPHFYAGFPDEASDEEYYQKEDEIEDWLDVQGYQRIIIYFSGEVTLDDILHGFGAKNPDLLYLVTGNTQIDVNHIVICWGEEEIHNVGNSVITGPCSKSELWMVTILVPTSGVSPFLVSPGK